jgi:hypothetical protein
MPQTVKHGNSEYKIHAQLHTSNMPVHNLSGTVFTYIPTRIARREPPALDEQADVMTTGSRRSGYSAILTQRAFSRLEDGRTAYKEGSKSGFNRGGGS